MGKAEGCRPTWGGEEQVGRRGRQEVRGGDQSHWPRGEQAALRMMVNY